MEMPGSSGSNERLAMDGGPPVIKGSIPSWPYYDVDEIEAAVTVLRSGRVNYWTGDLCRAFEREFARFVGVQYGVAVANGTLALELALRALGIGPGDEVVTTPRTFYANVTSVLAVGARAKFADIDRDSGNITAKSVEEALSPQTKAIVAVHLAGWPCDMPELRALADRRDLLLIEDCSQAHGGMIDDRMVGSWGDAAAFSFCQDKILTTGGEGGMLLTSDESIRARAWSYKDHGKSYEAVYRRPHGSGFRWVHDDVGSNWRMMEIQAAIGLCQLGKLPDWLRARRERAQQLIRCFEAIDGLRAPRPRPNTSHSYYRVYAYLQPEALLREWTRDRIISALNAEGVPCQVGSCSEVYLEAGAVGRGLAPRNRLPVAKELGDTSLCFQCHPTLNEETIEAICRAIEKVFAYASR